MCLINVLSMFRAKGPMSLLDPIRRTPLPPYMSSPMTLIWKSHHHLARSLNSSPRPIPKQRHWALYFQTHTILSRSPQRVLPCLFLSPRLCLCLRLRQLPCLRRLYRVKLPSRRITRHRPRLPPRQAYLREPNHLQSRLALLPSPTHNLFPKT